MAVQSHIESLKTRHQELENQLSQMLSAASVSEDKIVDVKRKKLQIKDRIEQLSKQQTMN